ncbi:hypothetical protein [Actinoplanes philippinensis]|uniref:hypothetical protein n=1 Tax=Actinoplanes philippinensis TaxID=35752 RepID=UPI00340A8D25
MAIRTVVFDLGGVVCRHLPRRRLDELARLSGRTADDVHRILYASGFIGETELGSWTAAEIVAEVGARLGRPLDRAGVERAWLASFPVDEEVLALAARVAAHHRAALFTNNDLLLREALLGARPDLGVHFRSIVFSAEIHAVEPTAEAFAGMGAEPSGALLVDDSARNVAGATRAGIAALRFRGARHLATALAGRGLLDA